MSRIGKKTIIIPDGVSVSLAEGHSRVEIKGPKGVLPFTCPKGCTVKQGDKTLNIVLSPGTDNALYGLSRALLANIISGVTEGFSKELEFVGVGYKAQVQGNKLILSLGCSHPVEYLLPKGISAQVNANKLLISGADKQQVGQVSAEIRAIRPPEPYKGKGVKYVYEVIRRKAGKTMGATTA